MRKNSFTAREAIITSHVSASLKENHGICGSQLQNDTCVSLDEVTDENRMGTIPLKFWFWQLPT